MVRVAVVGLGKMGLSHLAIVNANPDVDLVAMCDSSGYVLGVLEKYTGVKAYTDFERMLREVELDAVVIATPSRFHAGHGPLRARARRRGLLREAVHARHRGRRRADRARARARGGHPGRVPQPLRRRLPRGQDPARRRRDRRGHARPRRGLRPGRAQAQGRHLAQPRRRGRRQPLRLRRASAQPLELVPRRAHGRRRDRAQQHLLARDRRRGLRDAVLPRRQERADLRATGRTSRTAR